MRQFFRGIGAKRVGGDIGGGRLGEATDVVLAEL